MMTFTKHPALLTVAFGLIAAMGVWLFFAIIEAREDARQSSCQGGLSQLALALDNYHYVYGSFPPASIAGDNGEPMHSWRVLLWPFIGLEEEYAAYDFNEPWNGLHNSQLARRVDPISFRCPSNPQGDATEVTDYVAIVGAVTAFPGAYVTSLEDMHDGPENSILLVEIANSDIHWMEPRDLSFEQAITSGLSSPHPRGPAILFADSKVFRIDPTVSRETLSALITIDRGEHVSRDALLRRDDRGGQILSERPMNGLPPRPRVAPVGTTGAAQRREACPSPCGLSFVKRLSEWLLVAMRHGLGQPVLPKWNINKTSSSVGGCQQPPYMP